MKPRLPRASIPPGYTEYDLALEDLLGKFYSIMAAAEIHIGDLVSARKILDKASSVYGYASNKELLDMYLDAVDYLHRVAAKKRHSFSFHGFGQPVKKKKSYHERKMADPIYRRFFLLRQKVYDTLYKTPPSKRQELVDWFQGHPDYVAWKMKERKI